MRQGSPNGRRPRGRHHTGSNSGPGPSTGGNGGGNVGNNPMGGGNRSRSAASLRHQTFDSNGPDVRVRGNAWQVYEKYQSLARDATSAGDRVAAENFQQHAEHYYRIIEAINDAAVIEQRQRGGVVQPFGQQPDMPANYYAPDGNLMPTEQPAPSAEQPEERASTQVDEQSRGKPSPFFSQEEVDEHVSTFPPLVAAQG